MSILPRRDVYNQILSVLTLSHMTKIFEQRKNFDLRRLLAGSERLIDHLLTNDSQRKEKQKSNYFFALVNQFTQSIAKSHSLRLQFRTIHSYF